MNGVPANPALLFWAREQAGLGADDAAERSKIGATKGLTAGQRLMQWEKGIGHPTRRQLESLAKIYRRPIVAFYLKTPPTVGSVVADFRTHLDHPPEHYTPEFGALLRQAQARQQEVRALLLDEQHASPPLSYVASVDMSTEAQSFAGTLRKSLGVSLDEQKRAGSAQAFFKLLRQRAEAIGLFVQLEGDLGSSRSRIGAREFRGVALADKYAPFVLINSNDSHGARVFTLVHELAHIWLGQTGVGNASSHETDAGSATEQLCNAVAAEFLLPEKEFLAEWDLLPNDSPESNVRRVAQRFSVSLTFTAHRAWKAGKISAATWQQLFAKFGEEWKLRQEQLRSKAQQAPGGPSYFVLQNQRLGRALIHLVLGAVASGDLTYTRAARILRVKPSSFTKLSEAAN